MDSNPMMSSKLPSQSTPSEIGRHNWRPLGVEYDPIKASTMNGLGSVARDRGAIRALLSTYKPDHKVPSDDRLKKTLIVARIPPLIDEEQMESVFSKYGKIASINLIRDIVTRRSKGYGFVEFEKERHCQRAVDDGGPITFGTHTVIVDKAVSRSMPGWKPRRLGGGFGGNMNSGQLRFGCKARPWLRPLFKGERRKKLN